jgi:hypothetical protein
MTLWTRVFAIVFLALAVAAGVAIAQQSSVPPAPTVPRDNDVTAPPVAANAAPGLPAVPHPDQLMILIRSTLLAVNQANLTGNYTVLRDLGTPDFQLTNSPARLTEIFQNLRSRNIDLGPVAVLDAKLVRQPSINANGQLRLSGFFPSRPEQVNFDLAFLLVGGRWRLHGIALNTTPNETPVATTEGTVQPATVPASKSEAAKKKPVAAATDPAIPPAASPRAPSPKKAAEQKAPPPSATVEGNVADTPIPKSKPPVNNSLNVNKMFGQ